MNTKLKIGLIILIIGILLIVGFILFRHPIINFNSMNQQSNGEITKQDDGFIVFLSSGLESIHADGTGRKQLFSSAVHIFSWSTTNQKIIFSASEDVKSYNRYLTDISSFDINNGKVQTLYRTLEHEAVGYAVYSPDGKKILSLIYIVDEKGKISEYQIRVLNEDENDWKTIMSIPNEDIYYMLMTSWTPDGKYYIYIDRFNRLVAETLDGKKSKELIQGKKFESIGRWVFSPDGKILLIEASPYGSPFMHIYLLNLEEEDIIDITPSNDDSFGKPTWSPNGKYISCKSYSHGGLYIYNNESEKWTQIVIYQGDTSHEGNIEGYSWSPSGNEIIVTHNIMHLHADIRDCKELNSKWTGLFIINILSDKVGPLLKTSFNSDGYVIWHR